MSQKPASCKNPPISRPEYCSPSTYISISITILKAATPNGIAHGEGVFPLLATRPHSLAEVCQELGLKRRAAEAILSVCIAQGFLTQADGRYTLTAVAEDYHGRQRSRRCR